MERKTGRYFDRAVVGMGLVLLLAALTANPTLAAGEKTYVCTVPGDGAVRDTAG